MMYNVTTAKILCFSKVTYKVTYKTYIELNRAVFNIIKSV